jgi:hypothetical protein
MFDMDQSEVFLTSRQVRERYGNVSAMWIWRRLNEPDSNFPKPTVIASRRFWRECELIAWERSLGREAA